MPLRVVGMCAQPQTSVEAAASVVKKQVRHRTLVSPLIGLMFSQCRRMLTVPGHAQCRCVEAQSRPAFSARVQHGVADGRQSSFINNIQHDPFICR
jgi:hypothetical protein